MTALINTRSSILSPQLIIIVVVVVIIVVIVIIYHALKVGRNDYVDAKTKLEKFSAYESVENTH